MDMSWQRIDCAVFMIGGVRGRTESESCGAEGGAEGSKCTSLREFPYVWHPKKMELTSWTQSCIVLLLMRLSGLLCCNTTLGKADFHFMR